MEKSDVQNFKFTSQPITLTDLASMSPAVK